MSELSDELRRLSIRPAADERPSGLGTVRFHVTAEKDASAVLDRAREVLEAVLRVQLRQETVVLGEWAEALPQWFTDQCAPELTRAEAQAYLERWRSLTPSQQEVEGKTKRWALADWLYWFESERRSWAWWDGVVVDESNIVIAVKTDEWPFPWGALSWLFRASGAMSVEPEE